ncbi:MAG: PEP-CTERM system histidine kinase PrsK [Gammaproteobacteria bacterium]|nr:PEP-CTERM system histidine kinase PrsK [Gammaproteobacteria bacterium]
MNSFGTASYALAAGLFGILAILLLTSWRGRLQGGLLIGASLVTVIWAALIAIQGKTPAIPLAGVVTAEFLRDGVWIMFLANLAGALGVSKLTRRLAHIAWVGALAMALLLWWQSSGLSIAASGVVLVPGGLAVSLMGLILIEQIYRNAPHQTRAALKYILFAIGGLFVYDLFLYSQAFLFKAISADAWNARGVVNAMLVPFLALAVRRNPNLSLELFVSRHVVFYSTTLTAVGIYLVAISAGAYYIRLFGGTWGGVVQIVFVVGAIGVLMTLLTSDSLRGKLRVFLGKHFYKNKFDYREEWLHLIAEMTTQAGGRDLFAMPIRALSHIVGSDGGSFWLHDETRKIYDCRACVGTEEITETLREDDSLIEFLKDRDWIIEMEEWRQHPENYANLAMPSCLIKNAGTALVVPLLLGEDLIGFVVLQAGQRTEGLDYEDRDLLKTAGRQLATHIARHKADELLTESRQFDAYHRLTAFIMHDLKNLIAQLSLLVGNAEKHKANPEFVDDMIETVANSVDRMNRLMNQLRHGEVQEQVQSMDLREAVERAILRCAERRPIPELISDEKSMLVKADSGRLVQMLEHLIRNAQDATTDEGSVRVQILKKASQACLLVEDSGSGMDEEFIRERLFKPFDSTKGTKGMGIGAYQVRDYAKMMGGQVNVYSEPGSGTCFEILLPFSDEINQPDTDTDQPGGRDTSGLSRPAEENTRVS